MENWTMFILALIGGGLVGSLITALYLMDTHRKARREKGLNLEMMEDALQHLHAILTLQSVSFNYVIYYGEGALVHQSQANLLHSFGIYQYEQGETIDEEFIYDHHGLALYEYPKKHHTHLRIRSLAPIEPYNDANKAKHEVAVIETQAKEEAFASPRLNLPANFIEVPDNKPLDFQEVSPGATVGSLYWEAIDRVHALDNGKLPNIIFDLSLLNSHLSECLNSMTMYYEQNPNEKMPDITIILGRAWMRAYL